MLFTLKEDFLDAIEVKHVRDFATQFVSYVSSVYQDVYVAIEQAEDIDEATYSRLLEIAKEFSALFVAPEGNNNLSLG